MSVQALSSKPSVDTEEILLEVRHLKTYLKSAEGLIKAVEDVSFHIRRGETFCLVGESGSGKSVTALSIMQLLGQDVGLHSGEILFNRQDAQGGHVYLDLLRLEEPRMRAIRGARIAMIFQEPMSCLNPVFTVGEQIIEALAIHRPVLGYARARALAIEALERVRLPDARRRMDDYPHRLSGGERQRVMIAMALVCEPDLLIADEPTTALDVTVQAQILDVLKDLQRSGTSMLFITHDLDVVAAMADRVAVMHKGAIVESGTCDEVLRHAHHPYTRALLEALPRHLARRAWSPRQGAGDIPDEGRPPLLELSGLKVHFPVRRGLLRRVVAHVPAVDGVDLRLHAGRTLALVGESGCGKTSLGRAVLRLLEPTAGRVCFAGEDLASLSRSALRRRRRDMQMIFQDPLSALNPRLTVAATLTEPMQVHGIGDSSEERLERAAKMLERVQLPREALWRYPHAFSGGERQRIGIARALVLEPRFIVCDEITSALDVRVQAQILQILTELREERSLTLLFITHDFGVVEAISDETAVMHQGRIVERGPTARVCAEPVHEYTRRLLTAVPRLTG